MKRFGRYAIVLASAAVLAAAVAHAGATPDATVDADRTRSATTAGLHLGKEKYSSPTGARSEAGVGLSLGSHVTIQLNYARTASVPMMGYANDNGVLARLRIGF